MDKGSFYLLAGKETASVERPTAAVALLGYIGTYYILNFECPQNNEVVLTILLTYLSVSDTCIPRDIAQPLNKIFGECQRLGNLGKGSEYLKFPSISARYYHHQPIDLQGTHTHTHM